MRDFICSKFNKVGPSGIRKINEKTLEMERAGKRVYHFEVGRPDFDTPKIIKDATIKSIENGDVFYTSNYGIMSLREAVAEKLRNENNLDYTAKEVLITAGATESIYDSYSLILEEDDEILLPNPCWPNYVNAAYIMGAVPVRYSLAEENDFQIDFDELEGLVTEKTKAIVIINPSNPIGSMFTLETLEKLADFAKKKDILVISDEIYEKIIYGNKKHVSMASLDGMKERTITINGFSKTYSMTGFRLAYVAAPEEFIRVLNIIHQHNTSCATSFVQHGGITAIKEGGDAAEEMVKEYKRRRDYIVEKVNSIEGLSLNAPDGAFYAFINIKELGVSSEEFCNYLLDEECVAIVPGTVFGSAGEGFVRFSYASSYEDIVEGLNRMEKACKHFLNK
ncbi:MAG: pyridoxal phosphate-dependent aminotransferase [Peptoniphilus harei]|uniref:pyridoxal phosphate-dependent aminotransferase n=1 Tax=Peptoniphilus harei TaxID=54005 RepID=UPI00254E8D79|nr:pyridoxal phosphate-dependent aminotransferase [Peptoniphilus harei]MDK7755645.1 pyridoxal phosphate-dependent aminotransferase [Peptoniphilus harei]MDK7761300.1 pyridoxal phosphate-dependent aminotransferase [Peptoniphilus harei]MDK8271327.1 pyridoxal phosphate-dependent aminotransferase [Peptoniphilus harei]MDK8339847.1 pyridoxal phosphate-dependent aminotransferase [Peptoniphilus harei]